MSDISSSKNEYNFTWSIENFNCNSTMYYFGADEFRSPLFTTDHIGQASWFLAIRNVPGGDVLKAQVSLVRYSEDEGSEVVLIQWQLNVTSDNINICTKNINDIAVINGFKKGYSCVGCELRKPTYDGKPIVRITLQCHMMESSSVKKPVFKRSAVKSNVEEFTWYPQNLLQTKLFFGPQNTQYELFFHDFAGIMVSIRRSDSNNLVTCFVLCYLKRKNMIINASHTKDRFLKPFKVNDTCDMSEILEISKLSLAKFINYEFCITGVLSSSVLVRDKCLTLAGEKTKIDGKFPSLKLDTTDLFESVVKINDDKKYSDVTLKIGSESFPAHKCFLSSCSPVFSAMFDPNMVENQTCVVNIPDMDVSTLKLFLKYIYTNAIEELHCENALKLLMAAEKYKVISLKEKCAYYLLDNLSDENVCEILVVADMISYSDLKYSSMDYVKANADKVLRSDSWKQFVKENANLGAETLKTISEEFGTF